MRAYLKAVVLWLIGGGAYVLLELLWRGRSHWTMFILGGICFILIGAINEYIPWEMPIWKQGIIGTVIITALEFMTGCIVNLGLGWQVWDYSNVPLNILGQICIPYVLLWIPISLAAIVLDDFLRWMIFGEQFPEYHLLSRRDCK